MGELGRQARCDHCHECRMGKTQKRNAKKAAREEAAKIRHSAEAAKRKKKRHAIEAEEQAQAAACHDAPEPEKEEAPPVVVAVKERDRVKDATDEAAPLDLWKYTGAAQEIQKRNLSKTQMKEAEQARIKRVKTEKKRINDRVIGYSK